MRRPAVTLLAALLLAAVAPAVAAAQAQTVTLAASATEVRFGTSVTLSGQIAPSQAGQAVQVLDAAGTVVATGVTDPAGAFSTTLVPEATATYRATWGGASSEPVVVEVRAFLSLRMSAARLFGTVRVRGEVGPARPGQPVTVTLLRKGREVETRAVEQGPRGGFVAEFRVMDPGRYRARAAFAANDLLRDAVVSGSSSTPLPRLREGSRGVFVELLEERLVELHYRLVGARDGRYDFRTADAIVAFHKVQRMDRTFVVEAATWRALADPAVPRPKHEGAGLHFEVDQTRQVLYTVEDGKVTNVLHVSTGAGGATRDGSFRVFRKIAGYSPNRLYYPSYFDGLRALHGWTEVPTYAASHGCVRIPYWNATWVYGLAAYGTRVVVYH